MIHRMKVPNSHKVLKELEKHTSDGLNSKDIHHIDNLKNVAGLICSLIGYYDYDQLIVIGL